MVDSGPAGAFAASACSRVGADVTTKRGPSGPEYRSANAAIAVRHCDHEKTSAPQDPRVAARQILPKRANTSIGSSVGIALPPAAMLESILRVIVVDLWRERHSRARSHLRTADVITARWRTSGCPRTAHSELVMNTPR